MYSYLYSLLSIAAIAHSTRFSSSLSRRDANASMIHATCGYETVCTSLGLTSRYCQDPIDRLCKDAPTFRPNGKQTQYAYSNDTAGPPGVGLGNSSNSCIASMIISETIALGDYPSENECKEQFKMIQSCGFMNSTGFNETGHMCGSINYHFCDDQDGSLYDRDQIAYALGVGVCIKPGTTMTNSPPVPADQSQGDGTPDESDGDGD